MRYNIFFSNLLSSTGSDLLTIISGSKRSVLICEIDIEGMELAGNPCDLGFFIATNPGTGGTNATGVAAVPVGNPNLTGSSPAIAFSGTIFTGWSGQPTVPSNPVHSVSANANGQRYYWATENTEDMPSIPGGGGGGGTFSLRAISSTSHFSGRIKIIEP